MAKWTDLGNTISKPGTPTCGEPARADAVARRALTVKLTTQDYKRLRLLAVKRECTHRQLL